MIDKSRPKDVYNLFNSYATVNVFFFLFVLFLLLSVVRIKNSDLFGAHTHYKMQEFCFLLDWRLGFFVVVFVRVMRDNSADSIKRCNSIGCLCFCFLFGRFCFYFLFCIQFIAALFTRQNIAVMAFHINLKDTLFCLIIVFFFSFLNLNPYRLL